MSVVRFTIVGWSLVLCSLSVLAQVPQMINYQGRVTVAGTNFTGTGQFKFALVDGAGATNYWSNDGTAVGTPATAVALTVTKGLYAVLLGNGMTPIAPQVFNNSDVRLRVWFDGGSGSQLLSPDQRIAAVGYAMVAGNIPDGIITSNKFAPGAVQGIVEGYGYATNGGNYPLMSVGTATYADNSARLGGVSASIYLTNGSREVKFTSGANQRVLTLWSSGTNGNGELDFARLDASGVTNRAKMGWDSVDPGGQYFVTVARERLGITTDLMANYPVYWGGQTNFAFSYGGRTGLTNSAHSFSGSAAWPTMLSIQQATNQLGLRVFSGAGAYTLTDLGGLQLISDPSRTGTQGEWAQYYSYQGITHTNLFVSASRNDFSYRKQQWMMRDGVKPFITIDPFGYLNSPNWQFGTNIIEGYAVGWTAIAELPQVPVLVAGANNVTQDAALFGVNRDTFARMGFTSGGNISWGTGAAARDTELVRSAGSTLTVKSNLVVLGALRDGNGNAYLTNTGINYSINVLTALPATFITLHFTNGILVGHTP
ncbi:MAG: hypothetical protein PCFJNLEI_00714 [Verrucomicrobiae bacterium]|nr:hypothetical protein [Verrucomicrobiae bacterium]